jgi:hypothetical protein
MNALPTAGYLSLIGLWTALAGGGLALSLFVTNPAAIGPFGVTLWFLALLTALTGAFTELLYLAKSYLRWHTHTHERLRYAFRQGLLLGFWITAMVALASLQQFNIRDGLLLGLILVVVELYMRLRRP